MSTKTEEWIAKVAKMNNTTREEVLKYLRKLSRGQRVIHHLRLV